MAEHPLRGKIIRTIILVVTWVCMGLYIEISGPTLQELAYRTRVGYEKISLVISGQDYGFLLGAILGGLLVDILQRWSYLIITMCFVVAAAAVASVPWVSAPALMGFLFAGTGVSLGATIVVGTFINLSLWQDKAGAPVHIMHVGFGIGSFIAPQIAAPFMNSDITIERNEEDSQKCKDLAQAHSNFTGNNSANGTVLTTPFVPSFGLESDVQFAFAIVASLCIAMAVIYAILQIVERKADKANYNISGYDATKKKKSCSEDLKRIFCPAEQSENNRNNVFLFMGACVIFYITTYALEKAFGRFLYSFARDELCFSVDKAAWLTSSFWISFAVGRLLGSVLAHFVPARHMILGEAIGCFVTVLLISILGPIEPTALWVLVQVAGLFLGPIFPSGTAYANRYVELKGLWLTFIYVGASVGGFVSMWIFGRLFKNEGPRAVFYMELGLSILHVVVVLCTLLLGRKLGDRFERDALKKLDAKTVVFTEEKKTNECHDNHELSTYVLPE